MLRIVVLFVMMAGVAVYGKIMKFGVSESWRLFCSEPIHYAIQNIVGVFVVLGVIIALWQYRLTSNAQRKEAKARNTQKAIEQAGYYKDIVLDPLMVIRDVYTSAGIKKILGDIKRPNLREFDWHELKENLPATKREEIEKIVTSDAFCKILHQVNWTYDCFPQDQCNIKEKVAQIRAAAPDGEKDEAVAKYMNEWYLREFGKMTIGLLNNLEFFAMYFMNNSADEKIVFQSLHQTYIQGVELLYFDICRNNKSPGVDKYYINVIGLYRLWSDRVSTEREKLLENSRKAVKK